MKKLFILLVLFIIVLTGCSNSQKSQTSEHQNYRVQEDSTNASIVYFSKDITSEKVVELYESLERPLIGEKTAVKLSIGEPPNSNYLRPELIEEIVKKVDGTIVECNTAYGGSRSETQMHYQVAVDHGYTDIAEVDIMDEDGSLTLPVENGSYLSENLVGSHFSDYDGYLVLSHFKGHAMAGFGGAIKNISIGIASSEGKSLIHSGGQKTKGTSGETQAFLASMAEAGKSVIDSLDNNLVYINVMNNLSIDCDCNGNPAEPDIHDIGILASTDPVALDQACVDLIYEAKDNTSFINRMESIGAERTLEHAQEIGVGNRNYILFEL